MRPDDGISVDHGKLSQGSADVRAAARDIEGRLDALENELRPLATDWTGSAKDAYHQAKTTWDRAIAEMIELLDKAGQNVELSNDEYKAADKRGAGRFGG